METGQTGGKHSEKCFSSGLGKDEEVGLDQMVEPFPPPVLELKPNL